MLSNFSRALHAEVSRPRASCFHHDTQFRGLPANVNSAAKLILNNRARLSQTRHDELERVQSYLTMPSKVYRLVDTHRQIVFSVSTTKLQDDLEVQHKVSQDTSGMYWLGETARATLILCYRAKIHQISVQAWKYDLLQHQGGRGYVDRSRGPP